MFELNGKVVWVTGSAKNIGRAIAEDFAEQNADVVVSNQGGGKELEDAVAEISSKYDANVYGVSVDISDREAVFDTVAEIEDEMDTVDVLVNNAAIRPHQSYDKIELADWNRVISVNLTGAFNCVSAVAPGMRERGWGRIINISGIDAFFGEADRVHVVSTKAGIIGMTRALASELGEFGITVNCIVPGVFDTERDIKDYPDLEFRYEVHRRRTPLGRLGQPDELSPAVVFLSTEEASFITGQVLHINGGLFPTTQGPDRLDPNEEPI